MSDIPQPWEQALIEAGFTDPRNASRASWNALSRAVQVHTSTLTAMAYGTRDTGQEVVDAVAKALKVDSRTVNQWVGRARTERDPYVPPVEANLLTREERVAVNRIISLFAESKKRGQHEDLAAEAKKTTAEAVRPNVTPGGVELSARPGRNRGKELRAQLDELGEESQDDGGEDPA